MHEAHDEPEVTFSAPEAAVFEPALKPNDDNNL
jgi:hypothetical protein